MLCSRAKATLDESLTSRENVASLAANYRIAARGSTEIYHTSAAKCNTCLGDEAIQGAHSVTTQRGMAKRILSKSISLFTNLRFPRRQNSEDPNGALSDQHNLPNATNEAVNKDSEDETDYPCLSEVGVLEDDYVYFRGNIFFKESGCPGQLYIVTRGSASGPTLILNWIPSGDHPLNNGVIPFTTDLGQVEMIRIFCHTEDKGGKEDKAADDKKESGGKGAAVTSGEMVISSRENKYSVFEFTEGNKLLELIKVLKGWKCFTHQKRDDYHHTFNVYRPQLELSQLHPEEVFIKSVLTENTLKALMDAEGRITDEQFMKKVGGSALRICEARYF